ncbi:cardiolipin synthetase 2 [Scopulibacillus darangshiensis]|uniref:Cardiolipin synthase n=1 Tax=Scopulibacillus darangshiensis TaxID=442528 RepID=A0A4R2P4J7_9BACL|nr:cardiolipin synthase [Scopulibacillus darangshiensis]TCP29740.1 cardiolipin synthetase 2 [Scopulibacillus darangshiensis]
MKKQFQLLLFTLLAIIILLLVQDWQRWLLDTLNIGLSLTVFFIAVVIFLENRQPARTITWLLVLAVFPVVGFIFYIAFGQSLRKRRLFRKKAFLDNLQLASAAPSKVIEKNKLNLMGEHQHALLKLAQKLGQHPVSFTTETKVLTNGEATFKEIIDAIKRAKHHVHLEYYIVRNDDIGTKLKEALIERMSEGVEVRFLYDAVGSWRLSKKYIKELEEAGAEIIPFFPVKLPVLNHKINFRNHRKIVVIDGSIGFMGGLNVGDEYLGKNPSFGFWRDTHLFVKGEGVKSLQVIFLQDWYYMTGQAITDHSYFEVKPAQGDHFGAVQMVSSSPYSEWEVIKSLFFSMITSAKRAIWIASPYLIPDDDILSALKIAALSGIDVKILVPNRPDKRIVFYASHSYFPDLLEAGVRIFEYEEGFMHSKVVIVDHELASIGTSNMDMRSFHLNFEVNAFLYRTDSTIQLVTDFIDDLEKAKEVNFTQFKKRSIFKRIIESTSRLLSPLL